MGSVHYLILFGGILGMVSVLGGLLSGRLGTPLLLVFLAFGMVAGREGPFKAALDDLRVVYLVGSAALAVILFEGGLKTRGCALRAAFWPALTLATVGVAITTGLVAVLFASLIAVFPPHRPWPHPTWTLAVLVGATVTPTDAASVSMLLSRAKVAIPARLSALLEIESGLNDPVSVFLTMLVTTWLSSPTRVR